MRRGGFAIFVLVVGTLAALPVACTPTAPSPDPTEQNAAVRGTLTVQAGTGTVPTVASPSLLVGDSTPPFDPPVVADEVIVRFDPAADGVARQAALAACGLTLIEQSPSGFARARRAADKSRSAAQRKLDTLDAARRMADQPAVLSATPNYLRRPAVVADDEYFPLQWHIPAINLPEAWDVTTGSDDIVVAVVDTGILAGHPDIQGRLMAGYDFIANPASARDGDGRDSNPNDDGDLLGGVGRSSFHGTHVAGIIAARTNNGAGVAGVTWYTKIMPVRALGVGGGTDFDVAEAIRYAAGLPNVTGLLPDRPARVINLSVSGGAGVPPSDAIHAAIQAAVSADVVVVAAAGNDGSTAASYPAAFPEVIAVGATDVAHQRAWYSNRGDWIDLMAPGGNLGADVNGDGWTDGVLSLGASDAGTTLRYQYLFENGTSMACPNVAGVAALILAVNPAFSASDVRDILQSTARDLGAAGRDNEFGFGLVDAAAAVREAGRRAGAVALGGPRLTLNVRTLDFGPLLAEIPVSVSNTGGGVLQVTGAVAETQDGAAWLGTAFRGSATNANVSQIVVTVNRANLADGVYRGQVTVTATDLPSQTIDVRMSVGAVDLLAENVYVLAVDPQSFVTLGSTVTGASQGFAYEIADLPPGSYAIYAGTDRDADGFVCETGDLCGALPSTIDPTILDLAAGEVYNGADFAIALQVIPTQEVAAAGLFRRLGRP